MIRVPRTKPGAGGKAIHPGKLWSKRANLETSRAISQGPLHQPNKSVYGADSVRKALWSLFGNKCAYCETKLTRTPVDVDHHRPKGRVHEAKNHPGYYWLTYTWDNLYPSCSFCNRNRREIPWKRRASQPTGGKADRFPLEVEADRAMSLCDDLSKESPLLVDPCVEDPADYFGYRPDGQIFALAKNRRATTSITLYNLKLHNLRKARADIFGTISELKETEADLQAKGLLHEAQAIRRIKDRFLADDSEYAAVARFVDTRT